MALHMHHIEVRHSGVAVGLGGAALEVVHRLLAAVGVDGKHLLGKKLIITSKTYMYTYSKQTMVKIHLTGNSDFR